MLSRSRKAKGRVLQNKVREVLLENFKDLEPDDIKTAVMGESGEDIHMSPAARSKKMVREFRTSRRKLW